VSGIFTIDKEGCHTKDSSSKISPLQFFESIMPEFKNHTERRLKKTDALFLDGGR
jgi:hypothetical protein